MSKYETRLDRLEDAIAPKLDPLCCVVFGDADVEETVAQYRAARNWPDDGAHPVKVLRLRWATPEDLRLL